MGFCTNLDSQNLQLKEGDIYVFFFHFSFAHETNLKSMQDDLLKKKPVKKICRLVLLKAFLTVTKKKDMFFKKM